MGIVVSRDVNSHDFEILGLISLRNAQILIFSEPLGMENLEALDSIENLRSRRVFNADSADIKIMI